MESRHVERAIVAAFVAVVLSFVGATWVSERQGAEVERAALSIHGNAAPSIRRLETAKTELRRLQLLVHRALDQTSGDSRVLAINASRELLDDQLTAYEALPFYPGESEIWQEARTAIGRLDSVLSQMVGALAQGDPNAARQLEGQLDRTSDDLSRTLSQDIDLNVAAATRLAGQIQANRRQGIILAIVLDGLGILLAIAAAAWSLRVARAHALAVQTCREMAERRAEELDRFAGRMAHDVRTPLTAVGISLAMADRYAGEEPRLRRAIKRAIDVFHHVELVVDALFDFARAGAHPDPTARTSLADAAEHVAASLAPVAERMGADIVVNSGSRVLVACSAGLVETALTNLVNNALTYVEGRDKRIVTIEVSDDDLVARVTVRDTGPGLLAGADPVAIFEPNVRGPKARGRGLGLGLATVKKITESHGGQVGVSSSAVGCTFWFTLPVASIVRPERPKHEGAAPQPPN